MPAGRYAPSPTGELHVGNLRTALLAWAWARKTGRQFRLRFEDLDEQRSKDGAFRDGQLRDLKAIGIDWDGPIVTQSERLPQYQQALASLTAAGLTFECFCTRRDIRAAASAAHTPPDQYPGTCLQLSAAEREVKRAELAERGAAPAIRLHPRVEQWQVQDELHGPYSGPVDAVVLQRGDGAFAYNLAVVVDDIAMGIDQVVRGDDLLPSAPVHSYIAHELGSPGWTYIHVPLVLGPTGQRLAKRDGAVTLSDLAAAGVTAADVVEQIGASVGLPGVRSGAEFLEAFSPEAFARREDALDPWVFIAESSGT